MDRLPNIHPGEMLEEDFLKPLGISHYRVAKDLGIQQRRLDEIVAGKRSVTTETALLLARYFGTTARLWVGLQADYDLEAEEERLRDRLQQVRPRERVK